MQWHLDSMKADEMWKSSTGKGITVAVIDSGVGDVPELAGQVLPGVNYARLSKGDERDDYNGHGTTMAAMIAGTGKGPGGDGSYGLAPGAKILPIRISEGGGGEAQDEGFVKGIRFAADSEAKIVNISMVGVGGSPELTEAVKYALGRGKLIFAGVGNEGDQANEVLYPAATPGVVGVAAIDRNAEATKESQHGQQVDLSAPGVDIVSACTDKTGLCKSHGTSDATALTSASAALIWSAHPDWTNNQVLRVMLNTSGKPRDGAERNDFIGYGVVRPRIALATPGDPGAANVYPLPDLAAAEAKGKGGSASAAPSASADGKTPGGKATPAPQAKEADSGFGAVTWIAIGLGACLLIGGAVTAVVVRRTNRP
ncbi:type VII secretion-associated serine protease mycosin [Streptomyces sp. NBC_00536]|uniref:type VII secretion-associated serine protease mycosin n=1 Tax=Streptomyces sp. NBC_00536 TaxID=2975769 RepID=UPI002E82150B|nr:type VII secretion-associated serine protease mycosin [Streptomyces sp. NBC_00536]WUC79313.1 type VII secretion-associated serine protease mycosin [Streptomyces sp. NBC_00536]